MSKNKEVNDKLTEALISLSTSMETMANFQAKMMEKLDACLISEGYKNDGVERLQVPEPSVTSTEQVTANFKE